MTKENWLKESEKIVKKLQDQKIKNKTGFFEKIQNFLKVNLKKKIFNR